MINSHLYIINSMSQDDYISVSDFNQKLKIIIKDKFKEKINITGELYNYKKSNSNIFASIRDDNASINIIQWRTSNNFKNGDTVNITAYVDFYTKNSNLNLIVSTIDLTGNGKIYKILEDRKLEYEQKGFFDQKNKLQMSKNINSIGIITAINGAALQDMLYVFKYNKFTPKIFIKNATVQGLECPSDVKLGIEYFNKTQHVDLIVIARGGGSIEDLMGFSDPVVLDSIINSKICIVSAIGHEIDYMLSDYIADIRAPTPSIAAEIISKTQLNIHNEIDILHINNKLFNKYISTKIFDFKIKFFKLKSVLHKKIINSNKNTINLIDLKLKNLIMNKIDKYKNTLEKFKFGFKSYINSKYNAMIIKNNIIIKSIDDISNGKFKLILNDKELDVKIKII